MRIIAIFVWLMAFTACSQGWNDFSIELEDGYAIHRLSGFGCILLGPDGQSLIGGESVGYIEEYALTESYLSARCELNGKSTYYLLTRSDGVVHGPYSAEQFRTNPMVQGHSIQWKPTVRPLNNWLFLWGAPLILLVIVGTVLRALDARKKYYASENGPYQSGFTDSSP